MKARVVLIALSVFAGAFFATAQDASSLISRWAERQQRAIQQAGEISTRETTWRRFDGPYGKRNIKVVSLLRRLPDGEWEYNVLSTEVEGQAVPPERKDLTDKHRSSPVGRFFETVVRNPLMPPDMMKHLRPLGPGVPDEVNGKPAMRYEIAFKRSPRPREQADVERLRRPEPAPIERITFWYGRNKDVLLRAVYLIRPKGAEQPLTLTTDYQRKKGIDVPVYRHYEGTMRAERRERSFTYRVDFETRYDEYRIER